MADRSPGDVVMRGSAAAAAVGWTPCVVVLQTVTADGPGVIIIDDVVMHTEHCCCCCSCCWWWWWWWSVPSSDTCRCCPLTEASSAAVIYTHTTLYYTVWFVHATHPSVNYNRYPKDIITNYYQAHTSNCLHTCSMSDEKVGRKHDGEIDAAWRLSDACWCDVMVHGSSFQ